MIGFTLTSGESATAWASGQSRLPEVCGVRVESVAVLRGRRRWSGLVRAADGEEDRASAVDVVSEQSLSETEKEMLEKKKEIARLRAAEKFIELETDTWDCRSCGYTYDPAQVRVTRNQCRKHPSKLVATNALRIPCRCIFLGVVSFLSLPWTREIASQISLKEPSLRIFPRTFVARRASPQNHHSDQGARLLLVSQRTRGMGLEPIA
mmetsp:Transcript_12211/g.24925  ORF Transcript_12211/g.24925 Transcript_12211/m.24925 type:complete len:208 (-) Transcript_12211:757-1380(-)